MPKIILILILLLIYNSAFALTQKEIEGEKIFESRCAICHGIDGRSTGLLSHKSIPPAPDLTSPAFQQRLAKYPGVIVGSIVLQPNIKLLSATIKKNRISIPQ